MRGDDSPKIMPDLKSALFELKKSIPVTTFHHDFGTRLPPPFHIDFFPSFYYFENFPIFKRLNILKLFATYFRIFGVTVPLIASNEDKEVKRGEGGRKIYGAR